MIDSSIFQSAVLFFTTQILAFVWFVMIRGRGTVDNLWLFFTLATSALIQLTTVSIYFPFGKVYFFGQILFFLVFLTFYIYSIPHSVLPNRIWLAIIGFIVVSLSVLFHLLPDNSSSVYAVTAVVFAGVYLPIIVRKIKYLKKNSRNFVLTFVSLTAFVSLSYPLFSAVSVLTSNSIFFAIAVMASIVLMMCAVTVVVRFSWEPSINMNQTHLIMIALLSTPLLLFSRFLPAARVFISNFFGSTNFAPFFQFSLYLILTFAAIAIAALASALEKFVNKSRNLHSEIVRVYRQDIQNTNEASELFDRFQKTLSGHFLDARQFKLVVFDEAPFGNSTFPVEVVDEEPDTDELLRSMGRLHEDFIAKNSSTLWDLLSPGLVDTVGGDYFIPVVYHAEMIGFLVLTSKTVTLPAVQCICRLLDITIDRLDKISLILKLVESQKQTEMLRHFREVDKTLSFVAHELRSPLTSIMFNIEVLQNAATRGREIDVEYLDISLNELRRLNDTIEKMLNYGRNIRLSPKNYEFHSFFAELKQFFSYVKLDIAFIDQTGREGFSLDWDLMKNVIINLVTNAVNVIEESGKGHKIKVLALKKRKKLMIEVSNDGPEIPEEFRASIFEPFYTTRKNGNGLGLATCEKIVRLSGGTIVLKESTPNITRFLISFPLEAVASR